jgi:class 3 adenylate cyclase/ActR/RegA family two-component response regulator
MAVVVHDASLAADPALVASVADAVRFAVDTTEMRDQLHARGGDVAGLPRGEVAFLFGDLEGSTELLARLGDVYIDVLAELRRLVRDVIDRHAGRVVDLRADECFLAFANPADALAAAVELQARLTSADWPGGEGPKMRIGLHLGQPELTADGYVGLDVHRAARVSSAGHGGQVLLTPETARLVDVPVEDLGRYELAGLPEPEHVYQLAADGLPRDFPPLRRARRVDDRRLRVVLADDSALVRGGIARLLDDAGMNVVAQAADGDTLLEQVAATRPDIAVVDIRMPPSGSDEGLRAAKRIRSLFPETGVLLLSQALELPYARELLETGAEKVGYLLKDRIADVEEFSAALERVAEGEVVLDAQIESDVYASA